MLSSRLLLSTIFSAVATSGLLGGCSTVTTIRTTEGDAAATDPAASGDEAPDEPGDLDTASDGGTSPSDASKKTDSSATSDSGTPAKPDSGGPVLAGGSITVTCPPSGFHAGPPVTISSVPSAYLPRCSAATKACYLASATAAAGDACLDADTTPPAVIGGESVNCKQCERSQGSYCLTYACKSEFAAYACCAQAQGSAACTAQLNAVTTCAGTTGKTNFDFCLNSLLPRCFM